MRSLQAILRQQKIELKICLIAFSDADDLNHAEEVAKNSNNKIEKLHEQFEVQSNEVRKKAIFCEIKSLEKPHSSTECLSEIKKVLSIKKPSRVWNMWKIH